MKPEGLLQSLGVEVPLQGTNRNGHNTPAVGRGYVDTAPLGRGEVSDDAEAADGPGSQRHGRRLDTEQQLRLHVS